MSVCSVYMQSAHATLDVKGTSEDRVMLGIRRKIRMKTNYSCCKAIWMCVCYWVSVRDDDISLGRGCDWRVSSADCDLWQTCFWALFTLTLLQYLHILCLLPNVMNRLWQQNVLNTGFTCLFVSVWYTIRD